MNTAKATLHDGTTVEYIPTVIGEGGMKKVYFTADKKSVLCFFKDKSTAKDPNRLARLERVLGRNNITTEGVHGPYFRDLFCWPTAIIKQPELGIMTPAYPSNFLFSKGNLKGKEKQGTWFCWPKPRSMVAPEERGDWLNYLKLCLLMSRAVRKMQLSGLAHSDLSCKNVLADPPSGSCIIIDVDSLVVKGLDPPDVLGTPGYIAPEVLSTSRLSLDDKKRVLPSNLTDCHALAVLIYEYLLRRHPLRGPKVHSSVSAEEDEFLAMGEKALYIENPRDTSNRSKQLKVTSDRLGPYLTKLFAKAFIDGLHNPNARPAGSDCERALYSSMDLLMPCGNKSCEEKWFIYIEGEKPKCPWCGWRLTERLPVLEFNSAPRKGQFIPENHCMVGFDLRPISKWHVYTDVKPVEGVDKESVAYLALYHGQWIIVNKSLDTLISPGGNPVPKGQACPIKEGDEVLLTKEEKGRLLTVKMIP